MGGARLEVTVARDSDLNAAVRTLRPYGDGSVHFDAEQRRIVVPAADGAGLLTAIVRDLDAAGVRLDDVGMHRPTLDDVFLALTGHTAEPSTTGEQPAAGPPGRRGGRDAA